MSQVDEPLPSEDEEDEKKTGRSAFFAGVHRGDRGGGDTFSGSFRGVPAPKHGGSVAVKPEDIIGTPDCWCGQVYGHAWPGKDKGAPHPRGDQMSAINDEKPYLNPRDLKSWDRQVVRALCALVNEHGVAYRIDRNQMHVYLTAPGQAEVMFKAGRSRSPETMLNMIEKWAIRYVRPAKVEQAATALAEKFNDPAKKPHEKRSPGAHTGKPVQEPAPAPEAPQIESSQASEPVLAFEGDPMEDGLDDLMDGEPPEGYERFFTTGGEAKFWKKIGAEEYLCKNCDYTCTTVQQFSGHRRKHNQPMFARKRFVSYLARAAAEMGIDLAEYIASTDAHKVVASNTADVDKMTKRIEKLEADLAKATGERDDLRARLDLIREAGRV